MPIPLDAETLTPLTDGEDVGEATNVNDVSTKLSNLVTAMGAIFGTSQAKNAGLSRILKYITKPLPTITWIDNATIEIAPCVMPMFNGNNLVIKENAAALQIALPTDLDTGSEAASTWYDVFLMGDGANSQYTAKFVVQGNTPSGATYYKKIFSVRNDGSSNILKFFHDGKYVAWDIPIVVTTTLSTGAWSAAVSCAAAMPAISTRGLFGLGGSGATGGFIAIRPNGSTWQAPSASEYSNAVGFLASGNFGGEKMCMTDVSQQIQHYEHGHDTALKICVQGYFLNLT